MTRYTMSKDGVERCETCARIRMTKEEREEISAMAKHWGQTFSTFLANCLKDGLARERDSYNELTKDGKSDATD